MNTNQEPGPPDQEHDELVNSMETVAWRANPRDFKLSNISRQVESLLGFSRELFLQEPHMWLSLVLPHEKERYASAYLRATPQKPRFEIIYSMKRADGQIRRMKDTIRVEFEAEQPMRLSGMTIDITEMIETDDVAQNILNSIPAQVFLKDTSNTILRCNRAAAESIGKTVNEVQGHKTNEIYPDEADKYYYDDLEVIKSGQPKRGIIEQVAVSNSDKIWVCTDKIPYRDASGAVAGVIVFAVDITENKRLENELIAYQENLQSAIAERTLSLMDMQAIVSNISQHVPGVIYQFLMEKDGNLSFPYISESCRSIMEYEPGELEGPADFMFSRIHPDDMVVLKESIAHSAKMLGIFEYEGRFKTKSGVYKWLKASSTPEVLPSADVLWNGLMMDVSSIKEAQEQINQLNDDLEQRVAILRAVNRELELLTHKLEQSYDQALEASRLKSEFVANISHEVRTPISAVIGMSELLLDTKLDDEQKEFTRIVRESAQSLLTIINDILDFSKVEAGKLELETIDVDVVMTVESCADLLASSARTRALSLMTHIDPAIPTTLKGDPVRLRQILLNLTSNAIKFTERGEVTLRASLVEESENEVIVRFEVADTGIGLSESARKHLFQPFVQADGSTSRKYGGTGLGLSISKRLVELMGGAINVESSVDSGSTFWFTCPLAKSTEPQSTPVKKKPNFENKLRALVLDSAAASARFVNQYMTAMGIKSEFTCSADDALGRLVEATSADNPFDLALIALSADNQDSVEFAQQLVGHEACAQTRFVLIASFEEREKIDRALKSGFSACLTKPLRQAVMHETIARVVSQPLRAVVTFDEAAAAPLTTPVGALALPASGAARHATRTQRSGSEAVILVAEDNPIMQQLAVRQVQKLGFAADAVFNGLEVLAAMETGNYAAILMDCQMPEMDGFEATAAIRRSESSGVGHVPIIAMTASAMQGDRDHCIDSGMDDYLTKPVASEQLFASLRKWLPEQHFAFLPDIEQASRNLEALTAPRSWVVDGLKSGTNETEQAQMAEVSNNNSDEPIDLERLKELYGGEGLADLLASFLKESGQLLMEMKQHIDDRDGRALAAHAHQLKGLAAVMSTTAMEKGSQVIERIAKREEWLEASPAHQALVSNFEQIKEFLDKNNS